MEVLTEGAGYGKGTEIIFVVLHNMLFAIFHQLL